MKITVQPWGKTDQEDVVLIRIDNQNGLQAGICNYGGILQSLVFHGTDVVLGYDTLEAYQKGEMFLGAMVGPLADKVAQGHFMLGDHPVQLPINAYPDCNHSGPNGFHSRVWDWKLLDNGVALSYRFTPEETGFPGMLDIELRYLVFGNVLRLEYSANSDHVYALSMTNHSYFTLNGGISDCRGHRITVHADSYAELSREEAPIYTGTTAEVIGTPMDLRSAVTLDSVLQQDYPALRLAGGLDHFFPVTGSGMREHARLHNPENGLTLICRSDAPGVLVYAANGLEREQGKARQIYGPHWGICLETESFPNAVNFPRWQAQVLRKPNETYTTSTEFELGFA